MDGIDLSGEIAKLEIKLDWTGGIYLGPDTLFTSGDIHHQPVFKLLKESSKKSGLSVAEHVRRAIDEYLEKSK